MKRDEGIALVKSCERDGEGKTLERFERRNEKPKSSEREMTEKCLFRMFWGVSLVSRWVG